MNFIDDNRDDSECYQEKSGKEDSEYGVPLTEDKRRHKTFSFVFKFRRKEYCMSQKDWSWRVMNQSYSIYYIMIKVLRALRL